MKIKYSKYKAIRTLVEGIWFDSKAEASRYSDLLWLERSGKIDQLRLKPKFELHVNGQKIGRYTSDFGYHEVDTLKSVIEDVKAVPSRDFILRFKLAQALNPQHEFRIYNVRSDK